MLKKVAMEHTSLTDIQLFREPASYYAVKEGIIEYVLSCEGLALSICVKRQVPLRESRWQSGCPVM